MSKTSRDTITVVGAGLAGTLLAVLLGQQGWRVALYERNPDPRRQRRPSGRSINLAIGERGRHALRRAGLLEAVDRFTLPMRGRTMHDEHGGLTHQPYGSDPREVVYSVHRARLNRVLLDAAEATGRVSLHFGQALERIDFDQRELHLAGGDGHRRARYDVLVGADGGGSAVRRALAARHDLGVSEEVLEHGYLELEFPPGEGGAFRMAPDALHIWPRGDFMLIALPNPGGSFTGTLFLSRSGEPGFDGLRDWPTQRAFLEREFPDAVPLLGDPEGDFRDNPVGLLGTIRCRRWHDGARVVLLGDAAHAVVPFHGQGMNAAFEDCEEFVDRLARIGPDWPAVFEDFEARRRDNANAIADMALENYEIMRASVRDPRFLLRKRLEHELERRHPRRFVARYSLVMFHRVPYAECYRRGEVQAGILDRLLDGVERVEDVDYGAAEALVTARLEPIVEPG